MTTTARLPVTDLEGVMEVFLSAEAAREPIRVRRTRKHVDEQLGEHRPEGSAEGRAKACVRAVDADVDRVFENCPVRLIVEHASMKPVSSAPESPMGYAAGKVVRQEPDARTRGMPAVKIAAVVAVLIVDERAGTRT